eukprot:1846604-Rhodomonas_salina.3
MASIHTCLETLTLTLASSFTIYFIRGKHLYVPEGNHTENTTITQAGTVIDSWQSTLHFYRRSQTATDILRDSRMPPWRCQTHGHEIEIALP